MQDFAHIRFSLSLYLVHRFLFLWRNVHLVCAWTVYIHQFILISFHRINYVRRNLDSNKSAIYVDNSDTSLMICRHTNLMCYLDCQLAWFYVSILRHFFLYEILWSIIATANTIWFAVFSFNLESYSMYFGWHCMQSVLRSTKWSVENECLLNICMFLFFPSLFSSML